jgi:hypothetical protein
VAKYPHKKLIVTVEMYNFLNFKDYLNTIVINIQPILGWRVFYTKTHRFLWLLSRVASYCVSHYLAPRVTAFQPLRGWCVKKLSIRTYALTDEIFYAPF